MKKNSILLNLYFAICIVLSIFVPNDSTFIISTIEASTYSDIGVSVYPKEITYNENAVITISVPEEVVLTEITIDASEVGGLENIPVDIDLLEQTIGVSDSTTAGSKTVDIHMVDSDGVKHTTEVQLEIKPHEVSNDSDFDWDEAVIYFLLTDRFMDGDPSNNNPNDENYNTSHAETYHGGDFQGIINRLDYLDELGINTIWVTPIVDNVNHNHRHGKEGAQYGYHGYWAKDFTQIDEHLGDVDTFKMLINEAHDRGIKIMVDVVLNHTGYGMKLNDIGAGIPNFPTLEEQRVFENMLREEPLSGHDILGEIYGLPDFKSEIPEVRNQMIKWQTDWLERARTDRGDTIDYFRVDTIKHMEDTTWNAFKNELTKIKPDFKLIGESWGATYNNTNGYLHSGRMDSLLDFDFKRIASMFAHGNIEQAELELAKRNEALENTATVGHFLSSHDEDGFLYYFMQGDENLFKVAISLQMTAKGQPVIYYGEEIGLSGKAEGDMNQGEFSENRSDFDWELVEGHHLVGHYQKILASRKAHSKVFAKGNRQHIGGSNEEGHSVFSRTFEDDTVVVALNTLPEVVETSFEVGFEPGTRIIDEYNDVEYTVSENQTLEITIPSNVDGGTVILAIAGENLLSNSKKAYIYLVGFIISLIIGLLISGYIRKEKEDE